ncbi:hypothetical protein GLW36_15255 [Halorubrum terrestre]|uniref:VanZ-like domain-containing protein n=1 Tax=Halorubrum distributum TaxID=29283 RepID=A0A6B1IHS9_9EURY|nr:hypothetical protein [Halorubrum terrestre]MYL17996.1 hypothetical protein [Halorubrum terrestre]
MLDILRSSPLFSIRRLGFALLLTVFVLVTDVLFIRFMDIQSTADFVYETVINTLGAYGGFSIMALFNKPNTSR